MKLNVLEKTFFEQVLNAELDVPVPATLSFGNHTFKVIIVPEINSDGFFILKYYNAPANDPEPESGEGGEGSVSMSFDEAAGQHPLFRQAWLQSEPVTVQLHPTESLLDRIPSQSKVHPKLDARIQFAGARHRGRLRLENNQVAVRKSKLKRAEFCIVGFTDFIAPRGLLTTSVSDGWQVTLTKDKEQTRERKSHTGVIEKSDGSDFESGELGELLQGLKHFNAFTGGKWCLSTVVVGYDSSGRPVWGEVGRFDAGRRPSVNWFNNSANSPEGFYLERLFPQFWCRWRHKKSEIAAVIECYVHSNSMREAGLLKDSVAKSYAGLEMLAGLKLCQTIERDSHKEICKVLDKRMPHYKIVNSKIPVMATLCGKLGVQRKGVYLLNAVRKYVTHPLDKGTLVEVKQKHLKHLDGDQTHYVYLQDLCQYYLDYLFLSYCGFRMDQTNLAYRRLIEEWNH